VGFAPAAAAGSTTYTLPSADGSSGQFLKTDGAGTLSWAAASGGSGTPAGSDTQVQFNDNGSFGGDAGLTYNKTTDALTLAGALAAGATTITSTSANALAVGANGTTNPVLKVNASTASVATGISITGAAAASRAALAVVSSGTDEGLSLDAKGAGTIRLGATSTGAVEFSRNAVPTSSDGAALGTSALMWSDLFLASGAVINFNNGDVTMTHSANTLAFGGAASGYTFDANETITSTSASALAVGANGTTNPVLKVDASTASVATGISITGAAAASRAVVGVISSGANEGLSIDAKGSGTIRLGATSTGAVEFSRNAVPTANDGAALGTTALKWSDLFLASGAVVNFNNGDVTITHSADNLAIAGGTVTLGSNGGTNAQITLNGSTSGSVTLKTAAAAGAGTVFQLPATNGSNGQFLQTNGSGVLSWAAAAGGGSVAIDDLTDAIANYALNNVFLGQGAGVTESTGEGNVAVGQDALAAANSDNNVAIGYAAASSVTSGGNIAVGPGTLSSCIDAGANVAIGDRAGACNGAAVGSAASNVMIGQFAGNAIDQGTYNTVVGTSAGIALTDSDGNVAVGAGALYTATTSSNNVAVGTDALNLATGNDNIGLGFQAGNNITTGSHNVIIGYDVDAPSATTDGQLVIGNLIFGTGIDGTGTTISSGKIGIATNAPNVLFQVGSSSVTDGNQIRVQDANGNCVLNPGTSASQSWSCSSDERLKFNITDNAVSMLDYMSSFRIRDYQLRADGKNGTVYTGVIAQEVLRTHPDLVHADTDGMYVVSEPGEWRIVKAIQELKAFVDRVAAKVTHLVAKVEKLAAEVTNHDAAIKELKAANDNLRFELKAGNDNYASGLKALREASARQEAEIRELRASLKAEAAAAARCSSK
jgi:hypothetical protein